MSCGGDTKSFGTTTLLAVQNSCTQVTLTSSFLWKTMRTELKHSYTILSAGIVRRWAYIVEGGSKRSRGFVKRFISTEASIFQGVLQII